MRLASANITGATSRFPRPRSYWARLPAGRRAFCSDRRSPSSAPTTRCASFSASRPSTPLSNGRAEVILGRGSFTESYPLFGFDLTRYEELFEDQVAALRRATQARTGDVERDHALGDRGRDDVPADRKRHAADMGGRRREPGVGRASRALWPAAHARDHRRQSAALPHVCRAVSPVAREARSAGPADRGALARPRGRDR